MTTKFKGIKLTLGGKDLVVPPLNFRSLQQLQDRLATFSGGVDPESINLVVDATHEALKRNYPDMTRDDVIDGLDLENMLGVMEAVMDVSGMKRKAMEAAEAAPADPSTGPSSTPT
jgi:hypothetical protein